MGLDNGFCIRSKKHPELAEIEFGYFRKFYELDDWIRFNCEPADDASENDIHDNYLYLVTEEDAIRLRDTIEPIVEKLMSLGVTHVAYYDEYGYPDEFKSLFYGNDFDPFSTKSYLCGVKLCRLYYVMNNIIEICELNDDDVYITFYRSY